MPNLGAPFRVEKNRKEDKPSLRQKARCRGAVALPAGAGGFHFFFYYYFGLFSSSFLTSSAFHCFKGES